MGQVFCIPKKNKVANDEKKAIRIKYRKISMRELDPSAQKVANFGTKLSEASN
jgi:hypothetical protein